MSDNFQTTIMLNALFVFLLQHLKTSKWFPLLTTETQKANKIVSAILATLASAGLTLTMLHSGSGGAGTITISYAGFTALNILHFLFHAVGNYATQKGLYKVCYGNGLAAK